MDSLLGQVDRARLRILVQVLICREWNTTVSVNVKNKHHNINDPGYYFLKMHFQGGAILFLGVMGKRIND